MPLSSVLNADARRSRVPRVAALLLSGLAVAVIPVTGLLAQGVPPVAQETRDPFARHIAEASRRFGIPAGWIRAVRHVESRGDPHAVSSRGAMGLMQIMPGTWTVLRHRHGLGSDPFAPRDNILAGAAYLREMYDRYGTVTGMLAAYNAGPGRYDDYLASGRALPAETRAYVARLVPVLDGDALPGGGSAARPPADWREASLFVMQSDPDTTADSVQPDGASKGARAAVSTRAEFTAAPQSGGLFVRRSGTEAAP
ncbi:lytic transglycosylase domain-containing protein [Paracoccus onubensis]|uniref:Lytic transglycosylase domain-containing protein n=1 Tax=Paracoccus onubensis TaxID=1675788 RepID=A0A418STH2_9RHOB|nr:lytic transglycosylase domain-containing protein [Paracoccus onubensis]RJE84212.1 lytic transglycosylase domain-containing protein [Paracoccus onubensis]